MFLFIGGAQPRTVNADEVKRTCPRCGRAELRLKRTDEYLSLFFIPLFPIKRGRDYLICGNCGFSPDVEAKAEPGPAASMRRRCPRCRKPLDGDFLYCPYCGAPLGDDTAEKYRTNS